MSLSSRWPASPAVGSTRRSLNIFGVDALTVIAIAGRVVPEIEVETAVVPVYTRHPVAMALQTTQAAIGGRRFTSQVKLTHPRRRHRRWSWPRWVSECYAWPASKQTARRPGWSV